MPGIPGAGTRGPQRVARLNTPERQALGPVAAEESGACPRPSWVSTSRFGLCTPLHAILSF